MLESQAVGFEQAVKAYGLGLQIKGNYVLRTNLCRVN